MKDHELLRITLSRRRHKDVLLNDALAAEPIGPGGPWPAHFLGDVNFFFLYKLIAIMTGENLQ